ncbi:hypothetical protein AgCh_006005 [Apium graveolens]
MLRRDPRRTNRKPDRKSRNMEYARNITISDFWRQQQRIHNGIWQLVTENIVIEDVALVAGLEVNLQSVSQFIDRGFNVSFDKGDCSIISKKTGKVAFKGARKGSLFVSDLDSANKNRIRCFYIKAPVEQSKLCHNKLSHLNYKAINILMKKELVRDMPNLEFAQNEVRLVKRQNEEIKSQEQNYEFYKCTFATHSHGPFWTTARTPQQNGVVERKNRTLVETARTMLQDAKLPISFWEEAVNIACYTQNRYLINTNLGKSPYSILLKRKPTVKHLCVFGNKCFVLKDNSEYVGKFDSKVFESIFLGYSLERTAYKVYVLEQKKIMESTDVTIDDDKCPGLECLDESEAEALKFEL